MAESLDKIIDQNLSEPAIFTMSTSELRKKQGEMLKASFLYHYENCEDYRKYCEVKGIKPDQINGLEDAPKIPLLDSYNTLRKREFFSVPESQITNKYTSASTSGKPVIKVSVDDTSFNWVSKACERILEDVMNLKPGATLLMIPNVPQNKWAAIMNDVLPKKGYEVYYGLKVEPQKEGFPKIMPDMESIQKFMMAQTEVKNIMGYPFAVTQLGDSFKEKGVGVRLGENGTIIVAGGWKAKDPTGKYSALSRADIEGVLAEMFGVPVKNIREMYGCTEAGTGSVECAYDKDGALHKRKHLSPWCYQLALNPDTLEPVKEGEEGIGAIYDFLCHSYPGFILSDDIIKVVSNDGCECGRPGQIIEFVDRVEEYEARGCSFQIREKLFSEEYLKKKEAGEADSVVDYVKEQYMDISGDEIRGNLGEMAIAMEDVVEILKLANEDDSLLDTLDFVVVGKYLCYKEGKPTIRSLDELSELNPDVPKERIADLLAKMERTELVERFTEDGVEKFKVTRKADELGEAMFPMILWALKYAKKNKN